MGGIGSDAPEVEIWLPDAEDMLVDVEFVCSFDGANATWPAATVAAEPLVLLVVPVQVPEDCLWDPEQGERAGTLSVEVRVQVGADAVHEVGTGPLRLSFPTGLAEDALLETHADYLATAPADESPLPESDLPDIPESSLVPGPVYTEEVE